MKITVLVENHPGKDVLQYEHGLSLLIEEAGRKVLLDAGQSEAFDANAKELKISLKDVDFAVLSHGHYDHAGGFYKFFEENEKAVLYANKKAIDPYYSKKDGVREIGIPKNVLAYEGRFVLSEQTEQIDEGIFLVPHNTEGLEKIGERAGLFKGQGEDIVPDDFAHEQSLVFDTDKGLVIFNSCSHGGVAAIIREVKEALSSYDVHKNIRAYVGGFHMKGMCDGQEICTFRDEEIDELCEEIKKEQIQYVYTGHCTGDPAFEKLQDRLSDVICQLYTGMQIEF